jgi:hypothetical protein
VDYLRTFKWDQQMDEYRISGFLHHLPLGVRKLPPRRDRLEIPHWVGLVMPPYLSPKIDNYSREKMLILNTLKT